MRYTLAFSPCPNDTFMFWAMLNRQVDTCGMVFDAGFEDIEQLNLAAAEGIFDIIKISYAHYANISENYQLLTSGSALGFGNGPLLISRQKIHSGEIPHLRIAVPGIFTTANMLFSFAYPSAVNKKEYLFSDIEEAVLSGEADVGLLIHETRFTYAKKGLHKVMDMGEYWEHTAALPLPLGGIAVRRSLSPDAKMMINAVMRKSVKFALLHPDGPSAFVAQHAQDMNPEVCRKHINLYVNDFSVDLGIKGKQAVHTLFEKGRAACFFSTITEPVFVC